MLRDDHPREVGDEELMPAAHHLLHISSRRTL